MPRAEDLGRRWREAMATEWAKSLEERLSQMTESERFQFMRWFVGDDEARVLSRKLAHASPR